MVPFVSVERKSSATSKNLAKRLQQVTKKAVYVGIPASSASDRSATLLGMAEKIVSSADARGKKTSKKQAKKYSKLVDASTQDVNNAELLHIFSKGSPLRNQPPRPVLEPAIVADGNKEPIARELAAAAKAVLDGDDAGATNQLKRAGVAGQNAARAWFTDSRNGWQENAPSTVRAKGSDRPGIEFGAMRNAIVAVLGEDE